MRNYQMTLKAIIFSFVAVIFTSSEAISSAFNQERYEVLKEQFEAMGTKPKKQVPATVSWDDVRGAEVGKVIKINGEAFVFGGDKPDISTSGANYNLRMNALVAEYPHNQVDPDRESHFTLTPKLYGEVENLASVAADEINRKVGDIPTDKVNCALTMVGVFNAGGAPFDAKGFLENLRYDYLYVNNNIDMNRFWKILISYLFQMRNAIGRDIDPANPKEFNGKVFNQNMDKFVKFSVLLGFNKEKLTELMWKIHEFIINPVWSECDTDR